MIYVVFSVILNALAQIAMKLASQKELSVKTLFGNIPLLYAAILYLVSIVLWLKGLSGIQLSRAYPFQSLGYILVFGLSYFILNEKLSVVHLVGLLVICLGIAILGLAK